VVPVPPTRSSTPPLAPPDSRLSSVCHAGARTPARNRNLVGAPGYAEVNGAAPLPAKSEGLAAVLLENLEEPFAVATYTDSGERA
jgi:hypothetical protein